MARVFVDSGVLIAAARGEAAIRKAAVQLLTDPIHVFLTSLFVYLETLPKARFGQRELELALYQTYFDHAQSFNDLSLIFQRALSISGEDGAAAVLSDADLLVTTENKDKSIYRAKTMVIRNLLG